MALEDEDEATLDPCGRSRTARGQLHACRSSPRLPGLCWGQKRLDSLGGQEVKEEKGKQEQEEDLPIPCPHLAREAPVLPLLSCGSLAFSDEAPHCRIPGSQVKCPGQKSL